MTNLKIIFSKIFYVNVKNKRHVYLIQSQLNSKNLLVLKTKQLNMNFYFDILIGTKRTIKRTHSMKF